MLLNKDLNLIHALSRIKEKHIFDIEEHEERIKKLIHGVTDVIVHIEPR